MIKILDEDYLETVAGEIRKEMESFDRELVRYLSRNGIGEKSFYELLTNALREDYGGPELSKHMRVEKYSSSLQLVYNLTSRSRDEFFDDQNMEESMIDKPDGTHLARAIYNQIASELGWRLTWEDFVEGSGPFVGDDYKIKTVIPGTASEEEGEEQWILEKPTSYREFKISIHKIKENIETASDILGEEVTFEDLQDLI